MKKSKRRFVDDGWALWIDGDDRSTIYFNEWLNPGGKSFVDVSIRIYGAKTVKTVNVFVPFKISYDELTDMSYILSDKEALRALFNTNGRVDTEKNKKYTSDLRYDQRTICLVNLCDEYVSVREIAEGTVVTVDFNYISDCITTNEAYLIFRVPHKTIDEIFRQSFDVKGVADKIISLVLSPIIFEKYGYSIRINEARLLPPELNEIEALQQQRIRKALITIAVDDDYDVNDSTCYRIRRLEAELNRHYAPEGYNCDEAITYQWVEERSANMKAHYNFYFTLEHSEISKFSMFVYLFIVLIIGALGGAIYDLIKILFGLM